MKLTHEINSRIAADKFKKKDKAVIVEVFNSMLKGDSLEAYGAKAELAETQIKELCASAALEISKLVLSLANCFVGLFNLVCSNALSCSTS